MGFPRRRLGRWRATYAGGLAFRVGGRAVKFGEDLSVRVRGVGPLFCAGLRLLGVAARLVEVGTLSWGLTAFLAWRRRLGLRR